MTDDAAARAEIVDAGRHLDRLGLAPGRSGNLSVRLGDRFVLTGTTSGWGRSRPKRSPSSIKRATSSRGRSRPRKPVSTSGCIAPGPDAAAIVHLHSPYVAAASCLADLDPADAFPPLTGSYLIQVGRMPLVGFHPPGSPDLATDVERLAASARALLLANHGLLAADDTLDSVLAMAEEIESTARLVLLLRGAHVSPVPDEWVPQLRRQS